MRLLSKIKWVSVLFLTGSLNIQNIKATAVQETDCFIPPGTSWQVGCEQSSSLSVSDDLTPLVGDLDGDGIPEIVATQYSDKTNGKGAIAIFSGQNLSDYNTIELADYTDTYAGTNCALARLVNPTNNADTVGFIFVRTGTGLLRSYRYNSLHNITLFKEFSIAVPAGTIGFADFNNDGKTELYIGNLVFDAWTLQLIGNGSSSYAGTAYFHNTPERVSVAADVLPNEVGTELICGNRIYKVTTSGVSTIKTITPPTGYPADGQTLVADFDGDGLLDVLVKAKSISFQIYAYNPRTGAILFSQTVDSRTNRYFDMPTVGDIDGDGQPEIICSSRMQMIAYKYNKTKGTLSPYFTFTHTDDYGSAGVTLYDFNRDGKQELVYHDQDSLMIINGTLKSHITGNDTTAYCLAAYALTATPEASYPVVADCNADSVVDIIVPGILSSASTSQLHILSIYLPNYKKTARPTRKIWNQYAYNAVNVTENLTIPTTQQNPAAYIPYGSTTYNAYLQQIKLSNPTETTDTVAKPYPDLEFTNQPTLTYNTNDANYTLTISIKNIGSGTFYPPLNISVYNYNQYTTSKVTTITFNETIQPQATKNLTLSIPVTTNQPQFTISLNDRGKENPNYICRPETNYANNTASYYNGKLFEVSTTVDVLTPATHICPGTVVQLSVQQEKKFSYKWYETPTDTNWYDNRSYPEIVPNPGSLDTYIAPADSGASQYLTLFADKNRTFWVEPRRNDTLFTRVPVTLYFDSSNCLQRDTSVCQGKTIWKEDFGGNNPSDPFAEPVGADVWTTWVNSSTNVGSLIEEIAPFQIKNGLTYGDFYSENHDEVNSPRYFWINGAVNQTNTISFRKTVGKKATWSYMQQQQMISYHSALYGGMEAKKTYPKISTTWSEAIVNSGYASRKKYGAYLHMDDHTYPNDPDKGYFQLQRNMGNRAMTNKPCYQHTMKICPERRYTYQMWATKIFNPMSNYDTTTNELGFHTKGSRDSMALQILNAKTSTQIKKAYTDTLPDYDPVWKLYQTQFVTPKNVDSVIAQVLNYCQDYRVVTAIDDIEIRFCGTYPSLLGTSADTICQGKTLQLKAQYVNDGTFAGDTLAYQWQYSKDSTTWTVLKQGTLTPFALSDTLSDTLAIPNVTKANQGHYRLATGNPRTVDCSDCRQLSNTQFVSVSKPDTVYRDTILCESPITYFDTLAVTHAGIYNQHLQKTSTGCDSVIIWTVSINPIQTVEKDTAICRGSTLQIGTQTINHEGTYVARLSTKATGCDSIVTYHVTQVEPPQVHAQQTDIQQAQVSVDRGKSPYTIDVDNIFVASTTDTQILTDLLFGVHYVQVTDQNGCKASITFSQENTSIVNPHPCFSPNGDGVEDVWTIENIQYYPDAQIQIFDRYGKLLKTYKGSDNPWDGTYNGQNMPSADYWYIISKGQLTKPITGHFSLKR